MDSVENLLVGKSKVGEGHTGTLLNLIHTNVTEYLAKLWYGKGREGGREGGCEEGRGSEGGREGGREGRREGREGVKERGK